MNQVTPAIEDITIRETTINLSVNMKLASLPVIIGGTYYINSNAYYPSSVTVYVDENANLTDDTIKSTRVIHDLEVFCNDQGYDYDATRRQIQEVVEKR